MITSPTPAQIRAARATAGLTQAKAAALAGYGAATRWNELEAGSKRMDVVRWRYWRHVAGIERIPFRQACRSHIKPNGYLALGMDVLREVGHSMHVTEMLPKISAKMGREVTRPNVEGALVRGLKQGKIKRPRPSTYALV